jgi:uncharacterized protein YbjT (DUF2867 family)
MSNITVLSPNGLIGRRLVPLLRHASLNARCASRSHSELFFDWNDPSTFRHCLEGSDALYLVPPPMVASPSKVVAQLLRVAAEVGIRRVVAVSSLGVTFPYEPERSGRLQFEDVVRTCGIAWSILRPSGFMQNFSEGFMLPGIRQAKSIVSIAGDGQVAMVDCSDVAAVAMAALTRDDQVGRTLEITGPAPIGFAEIAEIISAVSGDSIVYHPVEKQRMAEMMRGAGVPPDYASILLRDQEAIRDGHAATVSTTVTDVTGRSANSFRQFAIDSAHAWTPSSTG